MSPRDLTFSEVTSRSFRSTWVTDVADVMAYLVRFRPAADVTGDYISLVVPGDTTTTILPHLIPLTTYEVNVIAQYDKGDSFPLTGEETTLEGESHHPIRYKSLRAENVYVLALKNFRRFSTRGSTVLFNYLLDFSYNLYI